jgi:hypothetical protein
MTSDTHGLLRLTRVTHVRGLRLARAAEAARQSHLASLQALDMAQQALSRQDVLVKEARAMFARDPACVQAKLWTDYCADHMRLRADEIVDAEGDVETAACLRAEAVHVVARHQVRSDTIAAHHAGLRRADRLQAENRAELDAQTLKRAVLP